MGLQVKQLGGQLLHGPQVPPERQSPVSHWVQDSGEVVHVRQPLIKDEQGLGVHTPLTRSAVLKHVRHGLVLEQVAQLDSHETH